MTKWPVHKQTHNTTQKHVEHQDARDFQKNFFCVFRMSKSFIILTLNLPTKVIKFLNSIKNLIRNSEYHAQLKDNTIGFILFRELSCN